MVPIISCSPPYFWRRAREIIRPDDSTGDARIAEISLRYKARFSRKAVLLVEEKPSIHFK